MHKSFFVCLTFLLALTICVPQLAIAADPAAGPQSLEAQNAALKQEIEALKRDASARDAQQKVAEVVIADLKQKLAKTESASDAQVQAAVDQERQRQTAYMVESDARLAEIKSNFGLLQQDVASTMQSSRFAMARAIVKSRAHREALRTVASLKQRLGESQVAANGVVVRSSRMQTTSAIDTSAKLALKPKPQRKPRTNEDSGFPLSFTSP